MGIWKTLTRKEMREVTNIGDEIRQARDEKCFSQTYMANQLGITQSAYYKLEAGTVKVTIERIKQIALILDKPIAFFTDKQKYNQLLKNEEKVYISVAELELLNQTISAQQKRIEALEEKILLLTKNNKC